MSEEPSQSQHPSQTSPYQEREEARRRLAEEKGRGGEGEDDDDEEDGEEDAGVAVGAVAGVACPQQAADAKHPACWQPGSVFLGDLEVCTFCNILITTCTYNIRQGEPCVLLVAVGPDAHGRDDGRSVGELLSDVIGDALAAGSSAGEARFQGYAVNPVYYFM
jgi:hypothetical protein